MTLNAWFRPPLSARQDEIASWIDATAPQVVCPQEIQRHDGHTQTLAGRL